MVRAVTTPDPNNRGNFSKFAIRSVGLGGFGGVSHKKKMVPQSAGNCRKLLEQGRSPQLSVIAAPGGIFGGIPRM